MTTRTGRQTRLALGAALATMLHVAPATAQLATPTPTPVPTATPTPSPRYDFGAESGKVTGVGVAAASGEQGNAIVKLEGSFTYDGGLDFLTSSVTLRTVLRERGGALELLRGFQGSTVVPAVLFRKSGNDNNVVFASPGALRPTIRLALRRKPDGVYLASLKVSRATIPADPILCAGSPATTVLDLVMVLDDGHHAPITVAGSVPWECNLGADKLRVPQGGDGDPGSGGNEAPKASVRVNLLTRDTGMPSSVLLDGSGSTDSDGTIASSTFQVVTKPAGALAFGPVTGPAAFAMTTLPPGDYAAIVVVTDNLGAKSTPASRTFSIH
jgi:hypothetical protein